jgi:hypothetical protein
VFVPKSSISLIITLCVPISLKEVGFKITLGERIDKKLKVGETEIEKPRFSGS